MTIHYSTYFSGTESGMAKPENTKPCIYGALEAFHFQERISGTKIKNPAKPRVLRSWIFCVPRNLPEQKCKVKSLNSLVCKGFGVFAAFLLPKMHYGRKASVSAVSAFLKNPYIIYMYWYVFIIHTNIRGKNFCGLSDQFIDWRVA